MVSILVAVHMLGWVSHVTVISIGRVHISEWFPSTEGSDPYSEMLQSSGKASKAIRGV